MLMFCGVCYMILSAWGVLQLFIMGILYRVESTALIENCAAEEYENIQDFLDKTRENYKLVSNNCFIASAVYVVILLSTFLCIAKARKIERERQAVLLDDELSCTIEEVELTERQKRKIK